MFFFSLSSVWRVSIQRMIVHFLSFQNNSVARPQLEHTLLNIKVNGLPLPHVLTWFRGSFFISRSFQCYRRAAMVYKLCPNRRHCSSQTASQAQALHRLQTYKLSTV